ncbi:MAG TPA: sulfotransferase [Acidimicrobiales bacterium]|nr:sulfotransferase [Acidimicrobiales bacterium]
MSADSPPGSTSLAAQPLFVACTARSGSTLLRWLLAAHPSIACPPESEIAALVEACMRSARNLGLASEGETGSLAVARQAAESLIASSAAVKESQLWCDKSLNNVEHLQTLAAVWPRSRFLLLHRGAMDFVASALEAQPWGFIQYGLSSFLQAGQPNNVLSLVNYWMDRTVRMAAFAELHEDRCLRLRYEDLVTDTEHVLGAVWDFLGVSPLERAEAPAFAARLAEGPADYKIWFTDAIHTESLGRGWRVPADLVREPFRTMLNDLLAKLGYPIVDDSWGSAGATPAVATPAAELGRLEVRVVDGTEVVWRGVADLHASTVTGPTSTGDGASQLPVLVVEQASLGALLGGGAGLAAALRGRTVRSYGISYSGYPDERTLYDRLLPLLSLHAPLPRD